MTWLALTIFAAAAEIGLAAIILTVGGYAPRIWLALRGAPQIHLSRPRAPHARLTPRSQAPRDSHSPSAGPSRPARAPTLSIAEKR